MKKLIFVALVLLAILITPALTHASIADDIAALRQQIVELQTKLADLLKVQKQDGFCYDFNLNLKQGNMGVSDHTAYLIKPIAALQTVLEREINQSVSSDEKGAAHGDNVDDNKFGDSTFAAVKKFQTKYGIPATGYVGSLTRAKLNELYGCKTNSGAPVINGISGPTSLKVGETGTWTIKVNNPTNSSLSYSVQWGDESKLLPSTRADAGASVTVQQTATFTHTYGQAGAYLPVFTISDRNGWIGASSISVKVTATDRFSIVVTSPNGGEKWGTYDTEDIKWDWPNAKRTDKVDIYLDEVYGPCNSGPGLSCPSVYSSSWNLDKNISARATYNWVVGTDIRNNKLEPGDIYKLVVCEAGWSRGRGDDKCDSSDNYFTITAPAHLMRICPDEKIINRMPTVGANATNSTYFIMDGVRWELEHFDLDWVTRNCSVKEETVY